jgi:ferredoxin
MHTVSIENETKTFNVKPEAIIFDGLDDCGRQLPHGCLAGSCGACRIIVTKGAENLQPPSLIEKNTVEAILVNYRRIHGADYLINETIRLSCRAKVLGDVTIKILD